MQRLLGVEVPDDAEGVLQDVHWGAGLFGYFPTYTLGNLMRRAAVEARARGPARPRRAARARATSRRCASGCASTSTATAGTRARRAAPARHRPSYDPEPFLAHLRAKLAGL